MATASLHPPPPAAVDPLIGSLGGLTAEIFLHNSSLTHPFSCFSLYKLLHLLLSTFIPVLIFLFWFSFYFSFYFLSDLCSFCPSHLSHVFSPHAVSFVLFSCYGDRLFQDELHVVPVTRPGGSCL